MANIIGFLTVFAQPHHFQSIRPNRTPITLFICLLLFLVGCGQAEYEQLFEDPGSWNLESRDGLHSEIVDERLHITIDQPQSQFWSAAGRRALADGVFEVDVAWVEGSTEVAYGLAFRATPNATDFYHFLVSADGYYSLGGCLSACESGETIQVSNPVWIEHPDVSRDKVHSLRVEAVGTSLTYFLDGEELGTFENESLSVGDIGVYVATFDSGATVAFDNLRFTPIE